MLLFLALAADTVWWAHDRWFHRAMRITFLSVGEGDAAVVRFANGRVMLIDAGGAWPGGLDFGERVVARYLWSRKIMRVDYLVVSHPDLDHFGGMAFIARNFAPREFWAPNAIKPEPTYTALLAEVAAIRGFVDEAAAIRQRIRAMPQSGAGRGREKGQRSVVGDAYQRWSAKCALCRRYRNCGRARDARA